MVSQRVGNLGVSEVQVHGKVSVDGCRVDERVRGLGQEGLAIGKERARVGAD